MRQLQHTLLLCVILYKCAVLVVHMLAPEHVCTWLEGSHLRQGLDRTQRLLFDWTTCLPPRTVRLSKKHAASIVRTFRQLHLNRFLFEHREWSKSQACTRFLNLFLTFEALEKKTLKDYAVLFEKIGTMCDTSWSSMAWKWYGWHPDVSRSAVVYDIWHADDVAACRASHKLNTSTCATCRQKYKWSGHVGPQCPATLKPYCCQTSDVAEAYLTACKPFTIQMHSDVQHILDTYKEALTDWAKSHNKSADTLLDEVYLRRRPEAAKLLSDRKQWQETSQRLSAELKESKRDASLAQEMYTECAETLRRVRGEQRHLEHILEQYKQALHDRDAQIHQMNFNWQGNVLHTPAPQPMQYIHPSRQARFG